MTHSSPPLTRKALEEELPPWGVYILESHHAPDFEMEWRVHDFIKVVYVISGAGKIHIGDQSHEVQPRDIAVVLPGRRNRVEDLPISPISLYALCLDKSLIGFDPQVMSVLPLGLLPRQVHFSQRVERRLRRLLYQQLQNSPTTPLAMVANGLEILSLLTSHNFTGEESAIDLSQEPGIDEMAAYIRHLDDHFFEASTIDDAANRIGIPRRRFTQLFRRLTGQTWLNHVQRRRVDHACRLLETSQRPITSIAFECGFSELSTFYRAFRKMRNMTPSSWRKSHSE